LQKSLPFLPPVLRADKRKTKKSPASQKLNLATAQYPTDRDPTNTVDTYTEESTTGHNSGLAEIAGSVVY